MRATGKTFRKILNALILASEGKKVVYFCNNQQMIDWTISRTFEISAFFFTPEKNGNRLKIFDGEILFSRPTPEREGIYKSQNIEIIYDFH